MNLMIFFKKLFTKKTTSKIIKRVNDFEEIEEFQIFSYEIAKLPIKAEIPLTKKKECDKILTKKHLSQDDIDYLHSGYWINVYYKNQRHGYHGINDVWTYEIRDYSEYIQIYKWIYLILGREQFVIDGNIETVKSWQKNGTIYYLGSYLSLDIIVNFKPRGYVLKFKIINKNDNYRKYEKGYYNTKTKVSSLHFYYQKTEGKIIDWANKVYLEHKQKNLQR